MLAKAFFVAHLYCSGKQTILMVSKVSVKCIFKIRSPKFGIILTQQQNQHHQSIALNQKFFFNTEENGKYNESNLRTVPPQGVDTNHQNIRCLD